MPSKSAKQARFMRAVAHNPRFAKKAGVPQSVGREYVDADKQVRKYESGGKASKVASLILTRPSVLDAVAKKRRLERLLDENPGIDRMVYPGALDDLAGRAPAIINLDAQDYLDLAVPVGDNYRNIFDREVRGLKKRINTRNQMEQLPELRTGSRTKSYGDHEVVQILDHDGRHRAVVLGDRGLKVPTEVYYPPWTDPRSKPEAMAKWLRDKKLLSEDMEHIFDVGDTAFGGGGKVKKAKEAINFMKPDGTIDKRLFDLHLADQMSKDAANPNSPSYKSAGPDKLLASANALLNKPIKPSKHADGGKVTKLSRLIRQLQPGAMNMPYKKAGPYHGLEGIFGMNNDRYVDLLKNWDPSIPQEHYVDMERWALGDMARNAPDQSVIDELVAKHGLDMHEVADANKPLMRVIGADSRIKNGMYDDYAPFTTTAHQSTTIDADTLDEFADANMGSAGRLWKFQIEPKGKVKVLPMPLSGQNEFILPRGTELRHIDRYEDVQGILNYVMQAMGKKHYADGGKVANKKYETWFENDMNRSVNLSSKNKFERLNALAVKGLAGMLGTINEDTGKVELGTHPGLIDELLGLPAAVTDSAPQWSKNANDRTTKLRRRIDEVMAEVQPHGGLENLAVASGEMAGQLPLPAAKIKKLGQLLAKTPKALKAAGKIPGAIVEYLSPSINPTVGNYVGGTLAGGAINSLGEDPINLLEPVTDWDEEAKRLEGVEMSFPNSPLLKRAEGGSVERPYRDYQPGSNREANIRDRWAPNISKAAREEIEARFGKYPPKMERSKMLVVKKADGGKVMGTARAIRAIKDAIAHLENGDRMSAMRTLSTSPEAVQHPHVQQILQMLKGPESPRAMGPLRQAVEADTNATQVPFLEAGGKVGKVASAMQAVADRMNVLREQVRAMPASPARDSLVDEYSGLRRQLETGVAAPRRPNLVMRAGGGKVAKLVSSSKKLLSDLDDASLDREISGLHGHGGDMAPGVPGGIDRRGMVYDPSPDPSSPRRRYQDLLDEKIRRRGTSVRVPPELK